MIGRNKNLYSGKDGYCYIKINIFTDGTSYVLDIYAKIEVLYQQVGLSDGGELEEPKPKAWW